MLEASWLPVSLPFLPPKMKGYAAAPLCYVAPFTMPSPPTWALHVGLHTSPEPLEGERGE